MLVEHFYRELAEERSAGARTALSASRPSGRCRGRRRRSSGPPRRCEHVLTLAPADEEIAERLADQAEALVLMAARFEQSADLARHLASARRPRP